jgi:hypothetical protein
MPPARRPSWRPTAALARALRVAGKVEPVFVEDVAELPAAIAQARDGDVVMCMGAGSIGGVPAKVVDLLQKSEHNRAHVMTMQQPDLQFGKVAVLMGGARPSARSR